MVKIKSLFSLFILVFSTTRVFAGGPVTEKKESFWTVQIISSGSEEATRSFCGNLQGLAGLRVEKIGNQYVVRCGLFHSRSEAERLKADLEKRGFKNLLVRTCYYSRERVVLEFSPSASPAPTPPSPSPTSVEENLPQPLFSKEASQSAGSQEQSAPSGIQEQVTPAPAKTEKEAESRSVPGTVSLDFKNADIRNVLRILAIQNNLNIIAGKEVEGTVTVHLSNVPLEDAFRSILEINGFGYEKIGDIFWVNTLTRIKERKKDVLDLEPLITEVFQLKYLGAEDLKEVITKELSTRGSLRVLNRLIPGGWQMGGIAGESAAGGMGEKTRTSSKKDELPAVLVVTDTAEIIGKVKELIAQLDVKTKQILIEAMLVEVSSDIVKDLGIHWSIMAGTTNFNMDIYANTTGEDLLSMQIKALEETKKAKVLSHPRIMALDGREAAILVGERYPILKITPPDEAGASPGVEIEYTPIGISLRVIPRVTEEGNINMLIHPEVTSLGEDVTAVIGTGVGASEAVYPRIKTREADTNVTVKDGETVVIGGLKSERIEENVYKVPLLGDIPILGYLFKRIEKKPTSIDLLIFITPRIIS